MTAPRKAAAVISELKALIQELGTVPPEAGIERGRALVRTLSQRAEIMSLVGGVLDDPRLLGDIAGRSYPHVNKFDKIVLIGSGRPGGYRLTLHLWRPPYPESALGQEMIHGHRFSFWSAIVAGTLSSEMFEEREAGPGLGDGMRVLRKYRYIPEASRAAEFRDFYEFEGSTSLACVGAGQKRAGDSYYLDASTIHQVILPRHATTCSLVLRGPRLSEHSYVYSTDYPGHEISLKNRMFSPRELEVRLHHLMSALREG
jgi:hypothetical protein